MLIWETCRRTVDDAAKTQTSGWVAFETVAFGLPAAVVLVHVIEGSWTGVAVLIAVGLVSMVLSKGLNRC